MALLSLIILLASFCFYITASCVSTCSLNGWCSPSSGYDAHSLGIVQGGAGEVCLPGGSIPIKYAHTSYHVQ